MKRILSLGAGVQSSTMALMVKHGELPPVDAAIFADTQAEPAHVYKWLDYLEPLLPFPVYRVSAGNLEADSKIVRTSRRSGNRYANTLIPFFLANADGSKGMMRRTCTVTYKIRAIERETRKLVGLYRKRTPKQPVVDMVIGISTDESARRKASTVPWISKSYPLLDVVPMSRQNCLDWMRDKGYPLPPKSSCYFCPFHSDAHWLAMREKTPAEFQRAIMFERDMQAVMRTQNALTGTPYLHSQRIPLDQVEFDASDDHDFDVACEGMCGL